MKPEVAAAQSNYGSMPNVCGVSFGSKFSDGQKVANGDALQFFVTKKEALTDLKRSLPAFVFRRSADGTVDRSEKIRTDVIELQNLELCCRAGYEINQSPYSGSVALMFRDKAGTDDVYALTCAHVVGDLTEPNGMGGDFVGGNTSCQFTAEVVWASVLQDDTLDYDIALTKADIYNGEATDLMVEGSDTPMTGHADLTGTTMGSQFVAQSMKSGRQELSVESEASTIGEIDTQDGTKISISNLISCRGTAEKGDSGGLVFSNDQIAGIIVAKSDNGWILVHSLKDAFDYLQNELGRQIDIFGT